MNRNIEENQRGFLKSLSGLAIGITLLLFAGTSFAFHFSEHHSLNFDSHSKKSVSEKTFKEISRFFHDSEKAIETEDLKALMSLYSDNYVNGPHNKNSVKGIWKTVFSRFDEMATVHNMSILTGSSDSDLMIIRCSGMLLGIPKGEKNLISIDNWVNNDHILSKEKGTWKLIGTFGKEQKRFWFDKPLHPLF